MKIFRLCCTAFGSAFVLRREFLHRTFVSLHKPLFLNRILLNESELISNDEGHSLCNLPPTDTRSVHIRKILKLNPGDNLRIGVINKGLVDKATLLSDSQDPEKDTVINIGSMNDLVATEMPVVDLILASPRPPRLVYLLPVIACLGVSNIFLIGASKVEKAYFSSHLFTSPDELNSYLLEGLSQSAVDCHLPRLTVCKNFNYFMNHSMKESINLDESYCVIAHPYAVPDDCSVTPSSSDEGLSAVLSRLRDSSTSQSNSVGNSKRKRVVIAIGPEGGWEEEEVKAFEGKGFHRVSLGKRILRTDIAVPVALGIANEWISSNLCHESTSP